MAEPSFRVPGRPTGRGQTEIMYQVRGLSPGARSGRFVRKCKNAPVLIVLLRHAEAEERSPSGLDADRRLTASGEMRARAAGRALSRLALSFDRILVSPLVRAQQTAALAAETAGCRAKTIETAALRPGAPPGEILRLLSDLPASSALLVGHQPHMGALLGHLLTGGKGPDVPMKKAALAGLQVEGAELTGPADLLFYLPPKVFEKLT